jgi:hypothetical protein
MSGHIFIGIINKLEGNYVQYLQEVLSRRPAQKLKNYGASSKHPRFITHSAHQRRITEQSKVLSKTTNWSIRL